MSLPKRNHVAKQAVSAALQTNERQRSERAWQTERCTNDEAVALRKNHVVRPATIVHAWNSIPIHPNMSLPQTVVH